MVQSCVVHEISFEVFGECLLRSWHVSDEEGREERREAVDEHPHQILGLQARVCVCVCVCLCVCVCVYCQKCITMILKIGTQRLAHQRAVKQCQAHAPLVHMTKSEVLVDHLREYVVLPDRHFFDSWWDLCVCVCSLLC